MKNTLVSLEILFPHSTSAGGFISFVRGSARFDSSSKKTNHGVVYDCDFRFAIGGPQLVSSIANQASITQPSILRLTFDDSVIVIGSVEIPAHCVLESRDPDIYSVKYTSLKPF